MADDSIPHSYVLLAGSWHGGWVWRWVADGLRSIGHDVSTPTFTGLGERHHLGDDSVDLETHIEDVTAHIEMEGLEDVTLVAWNYGGLVAGGVVSRVPGKIRSLIYLDAFIPENGKAQVDFFAPGPRALMELNKEAGELLAPFPMDFLGLRDPEIVSFVSPRLVGQPWRTFYQPSSGLQPHPEIPTTYICCTGYGDTPYTAILNQIEHRIEHQIERDAELRTAVIDASHYCMLTHPKETVELLHKHG